MKSSLRNWPRPALLAVVVWLTGIGLATPVQAQRALSAAGVQALLAPGATSRNATVPECIEVIKGDSTLLYYDLRYNLTPPACADIRRQTHVTDKGDFQGEARDYTIVTSKLRSRLHYEQGQRHGPYETYFANGQLAIRGAFTHGEPTGTWEFWYPSGKPQQTFEWTGKAAPRLRIVASWDSTGQPGVTNGNGLWQGIMPQLKRRYGGPVLNGLPQGIWESHALGTGKLLTTEVYEQGIFRGGKALDAPAGISARYKAHSLLEPQIDDPTAASDRVRLGMNCAAVRAELQRLNEQQQTNQAFRNMLIEPARPPVDAISCMHQLLDRLNQTNQRNQWENMIDGQEFTIRATVDDQGTLRLVDGQGGSGILTAVAQALNGMARWHPATADGKPMPGEVRFLIVKAGAQLSIRWRSELPTVRIPKPGSTGPG
ncbi:toxin-antitoxin system YwqK family antitoxin [Hymenobacter terricola]|uniref:toxin-antitoxin system YwqK family antitoxin n=1 Tax=Hymenobacter terricola TaxID=2819236 RepID=UPI001B317CE2|nr:hypothetical protein [Hymenobacter terricola]